MHFLQFIVLASVVMFASAQSNGIWSSSPTSSYVLTWVVSDDRLSVDFNVSVTTAANTWVAVGFSATQNMVSINALKCHVTNSERRTKTFVV